MREGEGFGICASCGQPLSKSRDRQISWIVNGLCLVVALFTVALIWLVRDPAPLHATIEPLRQFFQPRAPDAASRSRSRSPDSATASATQRIHHNTRLVTYAKYLRLKPGMARTDVWRIIGSEGAVTSRVRVAGVLTEMRHWQNPDGSNLSVQFRGGRLAVKGRFKLEPRGGKTGKKR